MRQNIITLLVCITYIASSHAMQNSSNEGAPTAHNKENIAIDQWILEIGENMRNRTENSELICNQLECMKDHCDYNNKEFTIQGKSVSSLALGIKTLLNVNSSLRKEQEKLRSDIEHLKSTSEQKENQRLRQQNDIIQRRLRHTYLLSGLGIGAALIGGYCIGNLFPYFNPWSSTA